jgi:hypothetical protein
MQTSTGKHCPRTGHTCRSQGKSQVLKSRKRETPPKGRTETQRQSEPGVPYQSIEETSQRVLRLRLSACALQTPLSTAFLKRSSCGSQQYRLSREAKLYLDLKEKAVVINCVLTKHPTANRERCSFRKMPGPEERGTGHLAIYGPVGETWQNNLVPDSKYDEVTSMQSALRPGLFLVFQLS